MYQAKSNRNHSVFLYYTFCLINNLDWKYDKFIIESHDYKIIDEGLKSMISFGNVELMPHFIYSGNSYYQENFKKMFLTKMKKFRIKSSILTMLEMCRQKLVTKEKAKEASEGKLKNERDWRFEEVSINDDLEMFLTNILNSKEIEMEVVRSFHTPKLTKNWGLLKLKTENIWTLILIIILEKILISTPRKWKNRIQHLNMFMLNVADGHIFWRLKIIEKENWSEKLLQYHLNHLIFLIYHQLF